MYGYREVFRVGSEGALRSSILHEFRPKMSPRENAPASRSDETAPKTFVVKTLNVKWLQGKYSS